MVIVAVGVGLAVVAVAAGCTSILGYGDIEVRGGGGQGATTATGSEGGTGGAGANSGGSAAIGGAGGQGGSTACWLPSDCPGEDTTCATRTCDEGSCGAQYAKRGTTCTEGPGDTCNGLGACVYALGHVCNDGDECATGICVDGVCCNVGCNGLCETCSSGTCSPVSAYADPDAECVGTALGCDGARACAGCGFALDPPGGTCPAACTSCTGNDTCVIGCQGADSCRAAIISCPVGWRCEVQCNGANSCRDSMIGCPPNHDCVVTCDAYASSCDSLQLYCPEKGRCGIACFGSSDCSDSTVYCGDNECLANCYFGTGSSPNLLCADSCDCQSCP